MKERSTDSVGYFKIFKAPTAFIYLSDCDRDDNDVGKILIMEQSKEGRRKVEIEEHRNEETMWK